MFSLADSIFYYLSFFMNTGPVQAIPQPRLVNLWPITCSKWLVRTSVSLPGRVRHWQEARRLEVERRRLEQEERERLEEQYRQEQG